MSFSLPTQGCSARVAGSLGRNEPAKRGIWRDTAEWGAAYSMVMTEAGVHDRMPAILPRSDWADWLDGAPDAAGLLEKE